ncbi:hypothetical protein [Geodermatophilus sp. URMC 64]
MTTPRGTSPERPGNASPAEMSLAEKLACEREARHDVAARGRIADVAPVQHYLTHTRCEDSRHPSAGGEHRMTHHHARPAPTGLSGWLRWGEDGPASESPHFPPV